MQLLPALLNPTQSLVLPNYLAILFTGTLVGATTAIIFAKTFDTRDPQEVFVYALGIPAILIATVSNLSTTSEVRPQKYDLRSEIYANHGAGCRQQCHSERRAAVAGGNVAARARTPHKTSPVGYAFRAASMG
jgi:hypothetical protein